jgi:hypothetical protein
VSLKLADRPIVDVIGFFARYGISIGLIVPTRNGLDKSIMDAHASLRDYLQENSVHDFARQPRGQDAKNLVTAWLVGKDALVQTTASMYRPLTKQGDPRIWFGGLPRFCEPGNVLAIISDRGELYVVNASRQDTLDSAMSYGSPLHTLMDRLRQRPNEAAPELLAMLMSIGQRGFVQSLRRGPTGIGFTLETLLGIDANSSRLPDYKGIEIKASRVGRSGKALARNTLFSAIPDWERSKCRTASQLLAEHGYAKGDTRRLACSLTSEPNSLGFFLKVEEELDLLHAMRAEQEPPREVVLWGLTRLRKALAEKHRETFWVKARRRKSGASGEQFHYYEVEHTMRPLAQSLPTLIEAGEVGLDFTLKLASGADGKVRLSDRGYLFKMSHKHREHLFPRFAVHTLA